MVCLNSCYDFKLFKIFQNKFLKSHLKISLGAPLLLFVWGKWTTQRIEAELALKVKLNKFYVSNCLPNRTRRFSSFVLGTTAREVL